MLWIWLFVPALAAQDIVWTSDPRAELPPLEVKYTTVTAPVQALESKIESKRVKVFNRRRVPYPLLGGKLEAEVNAVWLTEDYRADNGVGGQTRLGAFTVSDTRSLRFNAPGLEWEVRSHNGVSDKNNETFWKLSLRLPPALSTTVFLHNQPSAAQAVVARDGRPFYAGAAGWSLFRKLLSEHPARLEPELSATSAFLQVYGLPQIVDVQYRPQSNSFSVAVRGNGLFAAEPAIELTLRSPVPQMMAETFGAGLKDAWPTLRLAVGTNGPNLRAASLRVGAKEYRTELPEGVVSDVDSPGFAPAAPDPRRIAVVIGVEDYPGLPSAEFALRDAQAVERHLLAMGYERKRILTLLGSGANLGALQRAFRAWLPKVAKGKEHEVLVYFSGHGAPSSDPSKRAAYLVPFGGDPNALEETAYPLSRLYEELNGLGAGKVLLVLDSCFSGSGGRSLLARGDRPLVAKVEVAANPGKVVTLAASSSEQTSTSYEEKGHGLFTYFFLKGLNDHQTLQSLFAFLKPKVEEEAGLKAKAQTPQLVPMAAEARLRP